MFAILFFLLHYNECYLIKFMIKLQKKLEAVTEIFFQYKLPKCFISIWI